MVETIPRLDEIIPEEQDHRQASLAPKIRKAEGDLEWELPAVEIDRRVRAFTPWPGVTLPFGAVRVKVLRGRPEEGIGRPGEVLLIENGALVVAAGRGAYRLEEVQLAGRRPMAARMLVSADG